MSKSNRRQFNLDRHHIVPSSRFKPGQDHNANNVVSWDSSFHKAWHFLFHNMTIEEIVSFVRQVAIPGGTFDRKKLHDIRKFLIENGGGEYLTQKRKRRRQ